MDTRGRRILGDQIGVGPYLIIMRVRAPCGPNFGPSGPICQLRIPFGIHFFLSCAEIFFFFFFFCFVLEVACVCGLRYMILRTYLSIHLFMTNFILNWLSSNWFRPSSWTQFQVTFFFILWQILWSWPSSTQF